MKTVKVSQLKMSLSACLRQVKAGKELIIIERGRPIERLLTFASSASLPEHLIGPEEKGILKDGKNPLPLDFWEPPRPSDPQAAVRSAVLQREREGGW